MNVLDLFSGIGGFSLGLERAGMRTVAFCERDPFCRSVLARHWPGVVCYPDVSALTAAQLARDGIAADVICGGFPCQDISTAGAGAGLAGERSGLWSEYARLIGEVRPRYVVVENVAALLSRGLDDVLRDLAALGYDAEWHCIPASAVGAPHRRDRVWIVAYPIGTGGEAWSADRVGVDDRSRRDKGQPTGAGSQASAMADAKRERQPGPGESIVARYCQALGKGEANDAFDGGVGSVWRTEPDVGRVAHGVPARVDRLRSLGNAVVPQIPEIIGHAIMRVAGSDGASL